MKVHFLLKIHCKNIRGLFVVVIPSVLPDSYDPTEPQGVSLGNFSFDNNFVVSFEVSAHCILGGHFSVGIDITRFVEVFCEK